jgi:hypothetical protein
MRLGGVASKVEAGLNRAGYAELRWFPIGSRYQHGFAVTTKLERMAEGRGSPSGRWLSLYPEPVNLRWLTFARSPTLPEAGQYRAFLIAFTDLPMSSSNMASVWNEQTIMDGPGAPQRRNAPLDVTEEPANGGYRVGIFEYCYDRNAAEQSGRLRLIDGANRIAEWPSPLHDLLQTNGRAQE